MSKLMIENILSDLVESDPEWGVLNLRYFNPVGSHKSGFIGESPSGIPNNLMPFINQAALGQREKLFIFGNDYDTHDGTGIRDYIHVADLALGHTKAVEKCVKYTGFKTINLGTGKGYSVLDVLNEFEKVTGCQVPFEYAPRRTGDVACCYADPTLASEFLDWKAQLNLSDMCFDSWKWACKKST
jgi:UDP-glucose 4-epimerase